MLDEADVKRSIVYDQLGATHKLPEGIRNILEQRLVDQKFVGDTVDADGLGLDLTLGVDVLVIRAPRKAPVDELNGANLDQAVAFPWVDTRGFSIQNDLAHLSTLGRSG